MDKFKLLKRVENKEDKMLLSNILDKLESYNKNGISNCTNFLDIRTLKLIEDILKFIKEPYNVYKPNEECEKSIIYFGENEKFITIYKIDGEFKHQEILGTLFSMGIEIDQIGDIFIDDGYAIITVLTKLKKLFESSFYSIGNKRVRIEEIEELNVERKFENINIIIPSFRLDCIVQKLANKGRNDAQKLIKEGLVLVNYQVVTNNKNINIKDVISIRKVGKFIIDEELTKTKKDNFLISVKKYM